MSYQNDARAVDTSPSRRAGPPGGPPAVSCAEPSRLAAYGEAAGAVDEALARVVARLESGIAVFVAGAGELAPAGTDQWITPVAGVRAEVAHLGRWVAGVGACFQAAGGDGDRDGVHVAADSALAGVVGRAVLAEHRALLAAELATLHERARTGDPEAGDAGVARTLALARLLVDDAADPRAEARRLVAAMEAGDLVAALAALAPAAGGAGTADHPAVVGLRDLGYVMSLGLEGDAARAERWARQVRGTAVLGAVPPVLAEGLAVAATGNAPGTATFGAEMVAVLAEAGPAPALGLIRRLYGTTDLVAPALATAAGLGDRGVPVQAPLAHAIVARAVDDPAAMLRLLGGADPDAYDAVRRDVLVAAVDPSLDAGRRIRLANDLAAHYAAAREGLVAPFGLRPYDALAREGFGTALQPLLEHWQGGVAGRVAVDGGGVVLDDAPLWRAVGHLGQDAGGGRGLARALAGTTTARLADSCATGSERAAAGLPGGLGPFGPHDLGALGEVYERVAVTVGHARFTAVVGAVEGDGDRLSAAVASVAAGVASEVPGGSTLAGAAQALDVLAHDRPPVTGGGSTMSGLPALLTRDLVAFNLQARPDLATPALTAALRDARARDGDAGVHRLLHDDRAPLDSAAGAELATLQRLVHEQEAAVDLDVALAIDGTLRTEGG